MKLSLINRSPYPENFCKEAVKYYLKLYLQGEYFSMICNYDINNDDISETVEEYMQNPNLLSDIFNDEEILFIRQRYRDRKTLIEIARDGINGLSRLNTLDIYVVKLMGREIVQRTLLRLEADNIRTKSVRKNCPIEILSLDLKIQNTLHSNFIHTIGQIVDMDIDQFLSLRRIGIATALKIYIQCNRFIDISEKFEKYEAMLLSRKSWREIYYANKTEITEGTVAI